MMAFGHSVELQSGMLLASTGHGFVPEPAQHAVRAVHSMQSMLSAGRIRRMACSTR